MHTSAGPGDDVRPNGPVVSGALQRSLDRLVQHEPALRLDADPVAVHQARVAIRRFRSELRTLRPFMDEAWSRRLSASLRGLAEVLGVVRDVDVTREAVTEVRAGLGVADRRGAKPILGRLGERRIEAVAELHLAVNSPAHQRLLERLRRAAGAPRLSVVGAVHQAGDDPVVQRLLVRQVRTSRRRLRAAVAAGGPAPADEQLHVIRIATKQLRYCAEASALAIGEPATVLARAAARLQTILGDHHDAVAFAVHLQADAWAHPETAAAADALRAVFEDRAVLRRAEWHEPWRAVDSTALKRWL